MEDLSIPVNTYLGAQNMMNILHSFLLKSFFKTEKEFPVFNCVH